MEYSEYRTEYSAEIVELNMFYSWRKVYCIERNESPLLKDYLQGSHSHTQ